MILALSVSQRRDFLQRVSWMFAAVLMLSALLAGRTAWAAAPASGSAITNKATARFVDADRNEQIVLSNGVEALVQQVGALTLDTFGIVENKIFNSPPGGPGKTVNGPHQLLNTGNGTDDFTITVSESTSKRLSKIEVFLDADLNGLPDSSTPLCTVAPPAPCNVSVKSLGAGETFGFVALYTLPPGATEPSMPYASIDILAKPVTAALYRPNAAAGDKDEVKLVKGAILNVFKNVGAPPSALRAEQKWSFAKKTGPRSLSKDCATTVAAVIFSDACQYTYYWLTLSNIGDADGALALVDPLPAGMTYVSGSATWSEAKDVPLGDGEGGDPSGIDFQVVNGTVKAVVASLKSGGLQYLGFAVLVNTSATLSNTVNTAYYTNTSADPKILAANIGQLPERSARVPYQLTGTPLLVDLTNTPLGRGKGMELDGDFGPGPSPQPTTTRQAAPGGNAEFPLYVKNLDSKPSAYQLFASQNQTFPGKLPAGWTVKFVTGSQKCSDDQLLKTDTIEQGAQVQVKACVTLADDARVGDIQKIYFRVVSTSGSNANDTKTDAVKVIEGPPIAATSVTLTPPYDGRVKPGESIDYVHELTNTTKQSCGKYTVNTSRSPAGWLTDVYLDRNGDGRVDPSEQPLGKKSLPALAAKDSVKLVVRITAPKGAKVGDVDMVKLKATFESVAGKSCGEAETTDTTTVLLYAIKFSKKQANDADCDGKVDADKGYDSAQLKVKPNECILYEVVAANKDAKAVTSVRIHDSAPINTTLSSKQPGEQCTSTGLDGAPSVYAQTGQAVSCDSNGGMLKPGGTTTLRFGVRVNR